MKILLFSKHFWPERFRINLVTNKLSQSNNITVVTSKPSYGLKKIFSEYNRSFFYKKKYGSIQVYYVPTFFVKNKNFGLMIFLNYITYIFFASIFIFKIRKESYDLVFCYATSPIFQAIPALIYSKIKKIPSFIWIQDLWPDVLKDTGYIKSNFLLKIIQIFVNFIYNYADCVLAQSKEMKNEIKKKAGIKNVFILHNPEKKLFFRKIQKKKYFNIGYAGNLGKAQSLETLIDLSKKIKKKDRVKICVYGTGSRKNFLLSNIQKNNLKRILVYKGVFAENIIDSKLFQADAFILCLSKGEALSKTLPARLQTYMKFKKPILASADGALKNFINKNRIGFACSAENYMQLYKNVLIIKNLSAKKRNIIKLNINSFFNQNFEINNWIKNLNHFLFNFLKKWKKKKY